MQHRLLALITFFVLVTTSVGFAQNVRRGHDDGFKVVINHEEQYSVWPRAIEMGGKWKIAVKSCSLEACHDHIGKVWTDMRPLSLRKQMVDIKLDPSKTQFRVVINHEEQYSVILAETEVPNGWKPIGSARSLKECHDHIGKVWTDMRPLSMRKE
jgi:MbtH protein